ncbi:MAG: ABC transporter permease [Gemmatimonadetes bacterium]|nr:ABC transporter permease [Gemmatimonadota bacterium]
MERCGRALFRAALCLLPAALRLRVGRALLEVFEARQRAALGSGVRVILLLWARELAGVVRMAWGARRRDEWSMRADLVLDRSPGFKRRAVGSRRTREPAWDVLLQDVRFGLRSASRRPAPYLLALTTCALGIGSSVAMFSVVDVVLLRPLPYPDAARVMTLYPTLPAWRGHPSLDAGWNRANFSHPEFFEWLERQTSFVQADLLGRQASTLFGEEGAQRITLGLATNGLFGTLGASLILGRSFSEEDARPSAPAVALISHALWQSRFGGSHDVIGRELRLEGGQRTIVGVLPAHFQLKDYNTPIWIPISAVPDESERGNHSFVVIARLRTGVTAARAQEESEAILRGISEKHTDPPLVHGANVVPRLRDDTRLVWTPLMILLAASWVLLAVACVNVAALLLGIGIDREQELVVRGALGANRGRLVRQLITESVLLALAAGAAGVSLANLLTRAIVRLAPAAVPRIDQVHVDTRILAFALVSSCLVGVAFGLVPAISLTGSDLARRLRGARIAAARTRLHGGLVVLQLAMATLLLSGAGMLTRTLLELDAVDPGFDPRGVLTVQVAPPYDRFRHGDAFDGATFDQYFDAMAIALSAIPDVRAVGITSAPPFSGSRGNNDIEVEGYTPAPGEIVLAERYAVSANYMDLMRMRIVEGRGFSAADDRPGAAKVVVVNESLTRRYFPGRSAVGRWLGIWGGDYAIVGVVADVRDRSLEGDDLARFYMPRLERGGQGGHFVLRVSAADPASLADDVRASILAYDPNVAITSIMPMTQRIHDSLIEQRFRMRLMLFFATLAACFAVLGIYGVTSRTVASRTREIVIRVALGARRSSVMAVVIRQGVWLAACGVAIGLIAAAAVSRLAASFFYGTGELDPFTLILMGALLTALAGLASFAPSLRAASVDPVVALRSD